jgi:hypothetical protein
MRTVIVALYIFAGFVGCSFMLSSAVLVAPLIFGTPNQSDGMTAFGDLIRVVALPASFAVHGFFATLFIAAAESIRSRAHKRLPS